MSFPPGTQTKGDYNNLAARRSIFQTAESIDRLTTLPNRYSSRTMSFSSSSPWYIGDRRRSSLPSIGNTVLDGSLSRVPSTNGTLAQTPKANSPRAVYGLDPPRPPKEGYEWVWYPEGYWAEREFRPIEFAATSSNRTPEIKVWKWRKRSGKAGSGSHDKDDVPTISPKTGPPQQQPQVSPPVSNTPSSPQSPFRTEEAHILALQSPGVQLLTSSSLVESEWLAPKHSLQTPRPLDMSSQAQSRSEDAPATETREIFGFLSKKGISALSVLQKTKDVS